jgi:hypothetical protein
MACARAREARLKPKHSVEHVSQAPTPTPAPSPTPPTPTPNPTYLMLWPSYICQARPRAVFFLFALCCHACPCAVPNHPWLCPISVGVLRQSWPCQGRELPTAGRKITANGWLDQSRPNPRSNVWPCCLSNRPYSTCNAKGCPVKVCAFCARAMHQPCCHSNSHRLENRNS